MLAVVGTLPDASMPVIEGSAALYGDQLLVAGRDIGQERGTPALLASACAVSSFLNLPPPHAFLVGDEGQGHGSRELYRHLVAELPQQHFSTLVFHYLMPDVMWHDRVRFAVEEMPERPMCIADAGFMYAAKMSGQAQVYDLFTPDAGELAFLADESAPHPFYTRGFILHEDRWIPDLIDRAYQGDNAAAFLLVKGSVDYVADRNGVLSTIDGPSTEAMEAIGGTGDSLTGAVAALIEAGFSVPDAARLAARTNRLAGAQATLNPGSRIAELISCIPHALGRAMAESSAP